MTHLLQTEKRSPDLTRPDVALVEVSEWELDTPAAANMFKSAAEKEQWPQGLLSVSLFKSTDEHTMLSYTQWASEEAQRQFVHSCHAVAAGGNLSVDALMRSANPVQYRLYRSRVRADAPVPGCIVIVSVEFDDRDTERQRRWVDTVLDALDSDTVHPAGGISAHFHLSVDGTRVLNYAEWVDEKAHRQAMEGSGRATLRRGPKWREVQDFPRVKSSQVRRYHLYRSRSAPVQH